MLARYYEAGLGRFLSSDFAQDRRKNAGIPQRWNRYTYALNSPLNYIDPNGLDVTVAASAYDSVVHAYAHSATFRKQFDAANGNHDIGLYVSRQHVKLAQPNADAASDLHTIPKTTDGAGKTTRAVVVGEAVVPFESGGKPLMGVKTEALIGHELTHVNNLANGAEQGHNPKGTSPGAEKDRSDGEDLADKEENAIHDELGRKADDISETDAIKAIGPRPSK
jgi:uncharacterized protein RhaS with RHS repeats